MYFVVVMKWLWSAISHFKLHMLITLQNPFSFDKYTVIYSRHKIETLEIHFYVFYVGATVGLFHDFQKAFGREMNIFWSTGKFLLTTPGINTIL